MKVNYLRENTLRHPGEGWKKRGNELVSVLQDELFIRLCVLVSEHRNALKRSRPPIGFLNKLKFDKAELSEGAVFVSGSTLWIPGIKLHYSGLTLSRNLSSPAARR